MNKIEVMKLFRDIKRSYASFEASDPEKIEFWLGFLEEVPAEVAHQNLRRHILTEKFPPTIAELTRPLEPEKDRITRYHEGLRESAKDHLSNIADWEKKACPPPEHIKEKMRRLFHGA